MFIDIALPQHGDLVLDQPLVNSSANSSGASFLVGEKIEFSVRESNLGGGEVEPHRVGFYLGQSPIDLSNRIESASIGSLGGLGVIGVKESYTFTDNDVGSGKYLVMKADYRNSVEEENEENNTVAWGPFAVEGIVERAPEIEIVEPAESVGMRHGNLLAIEWNGKDADSNATVSVAYDVDTNFGNGNHSWLTRAENEEGTWVWDTSNVVPGAYFVLVVIDDGTNPVAFDYSPLVELNAPTQAELLSGYDYLVTLPFPNGVSYDLYVNLKDQAAPVVPTVPLQMSFLEQINGLFLKPKSSDYVIPFEEAKGSGLLSGLGEIISPGNLRDDLWATEFFEEEDGNVITSIPNPRPGFLAFHYSLFGPEGRKKRYYRFIRDAIALYSIDIPSRMGFEIGETAVLPHLNHEDSAHLFLSLASIAKSSGISELWDVGLEGLEGVRELSELDVSADAELLRLLNELSGLGAGAGREVLAQSLMFFNQIKLRHPKAIDRLGEVAGWTGRIAPLLTFVLDRIEDIELSAAREILLREYMNTSRQAQDRLAVFRNAALFMERRSGNPGDASVLKAIAELDEDMQKELTIVEARLQALCREFTVSNVVQFISHLNTFTDGRIAAIANTYGMKAVSSISKNSASGLGKKMINSSGWLAAASGVMSFYEALSGRVSFVRDTAILFTLRDYVALYRKDLVESGLGDFDGLREYFLSHLMATYLDYLISLASADVAGGSNVSFGDAIGIGVEAVLGGVAAPISGGFSLVSPTVKIADIFIDLINENDEVSGDFKRLGENSWDEINSILSRGPRLTSLLESLYFDTNHPGGEVLPEVKRELKILGARDLDIGVGETTSLEISVGGLLDGELVEVAYQGFRQGRGTRILLEPVAGEVGMRELRFRADSSLGLSLIHI